MHIITGAKILLKTTATQIMNGSCRSLNDSFSFIHTFLELTHGESYTRKKVGWRGWRPSRREMEE